jgi:hypothetical protein
MHDLLHLRRYGISLRKYPNRTTDRIVAPVVPPGQKLPPRLRLLERDGIASVGEYILPGDVYINVQVCVEVVAWRLRTFSFVRVLEVLLLMG